MPAHEQLFRGTVYILDADGVPTARRVRAFLINLDLLKPGFGPVEVFAMFAQGEVPQETLAYGPIAPPWNLPVFRGRR